MESRIPDTGNKPETKQYHPDRKPEWQFFFVQINTSAQEKGCTES